jgi:hypothetical protein
MNSSTWKFLLVVIASSYAAICNEMDMSLLGGSGQAIVHTLGACMPETISESSMAQVEECIQSSFMVDEVSGSCKECFRRFSLKNELELKSCAFKCNGPSRTSHVCLKCKETIGSSWDNSCFRLSPESSTSGRRQAKRKSSITRLVLSESFIVSISALLLLL